MRSCRGRSAISCSSDWLKPPCLSRRAGRLRLFLMCCAARGWRRRSALHKDSAWAKCRQGHFRRARRQMRLTSFAQTRSCIDAAAPRAGADRPPVAQVMHALKRIRCRLDLPFQGPPTSDHSQRPPSPVCVLTLHSPLSMPYATPLRRDAVRHIR